MPTNSHVRWWNDTNEQNLLQNLMTEAIQFYGLEVIYLPRSLRREDLLYNEDILSKFTSTYPIEVYLKNVNGWDGQGDFLSKFGLRIDDKISIMISRERFDEIVPRARTTTGQITAAADGTTVTGNNTKFLSELKVGDEITTTSSGQTRTISAITNSTSLTVSVAFTSVVTTEYFSVDTAADAVLPPSRPMEGDLIYFPTPINTIMEVRFVEHEKAQGQFYPLGKLTHYSVTCESWNYSHELIQTGDEDVDALAPKFEYQLDLELSAASGSGTYTDGESVYQGPSLADATASGVVVSWDATNLVLRISNLTGDFATETLVRGASSAASYYLGEAPNKLLLPASKTADNTYLNEQDNDIIDTREVHRIFGES